MIKKIIIDEEVENAPVALRVKQYFKSRSSLNSSNPSQDGLVLFLKHYKGSFLKRCPGTKYYNCCGYIILHTGEGCPVGCVYCVLQAYFRDKALKIWANQDDLFNELENVFLDKNRRFRIGTGEFIDSLALEPITCYHQDILDFLSDFPNVCLEIKTKTNNLNWINKAKRVDRVLPAWSLNTVEVQKKYEGLSASIEERLKTAYLCQKVGFRVCLHFDPILYFSGWEKGYREVVDMMGDYLDPKKIAYISLGSFRGMPELFKIIEESYPDADFIYGEFIRGKDGKKRLLRPIRVKQFRFLLNNLMRIGIRKEQVYLCMESDEVWDAVFGYTPKSLKGLYMHLLNIAFNEHY